MKKTYFAFFLIGLLLILQVSHAFRLPESATISDRASLVAFAKQCIAKRVPEFVVDFSNGYMAKNEDLLYSCNLPHIFSKIIEKTSYHTKILYKITYYPGMIIADAYKSGNISHLSPEQLKVLRIAESILAQTQQMSPLQAELFFHDFLCKNVQYYTKSAASTMPRHATAVGALIDKRANCQGYSDAFAMLCTMYGLTVDTQSGIAGKERHVWNVIQLQGKWYAVDVTWDDNDAKKTQGRDFISHKYFNAPLEIMRETHKWEAENETKAIQPYLDANYFYCTPEADDNSFGYYFKKEYDAIDFITTALLQKKTKIRVMAKKTDRRYEQIKFINFQINRVLSNARKGIAFYTIFQQNQSYIYISIDVKT